MMIIEAHNVFQQRLKLLKGLILLILISAPFQLQSQEFNQLDVAWAGLAFSGESAELKKLYKYSNTFGQRADKWLYQQLKHLDTQAYNLITDDVLNIRRGQTLSVALAIDNEVVVVRELAGVYQVVVEISASLLVFDFDSEDKAVIASYAISPGVNDIETFSHRPRQQDLAGLVEGYLFGESSNQPSGGLLQAAVEKLKEIEIKPRYAARMGVGDVTVSSEAKTVLRKFLGEDEAAMKSYLARETARVFSRSHNVSVTPYLADHAVSKAALRFTGRQTSLLLTFPEPDYKIDIHLEKFAKNLHKKNQHESLYVYGVRSMLRVNDSFDDDLFSASLRDGVPKKVLHSQDVVNDWATYQGAWLELNENFARQIDAPERQWLKKQGFEKAQVKKVKKQLRNLERVIEECR